MAPTTPPVSTPEFPMNRDSDVNLKGFARQYCAGDPAVGDDMGKSECVSDALRFAYASKDADTGFFRARERGTVTPDYMFKKIMPPAGSAA